MTEAAIKITIDRTADTDTALHPLLAARYSPRSYDPGFEIAPETVIALLEAARWAPSALNHQPRRFILGLNGDVNFSALFDVLNPVNRLWAGRASALICGLAVTHDEIGNALNFADYDLGQAIAHLTFQASASGLHLRQIGGFDAHPLIGAFNLAANLRPRIIVAIGREADVEALPDELIARETPKRKRLPIDELLVAGNGIQRSVDYI